MKPLVSVIVPVKDRRNLLLRCLDSIKRQTYRPLEVLVVDNGSSDGTPEAVQCWGIRNSTKDFRVKVLFESTPGACAARNKGLNQAMGQLTVFFDSDDTMRENLVNRAVEVFTKSPETDVVCWKVDIHQLDGSLRQPPFNPHRAMEDHLVNAILRTQGYMARTGLFRSVGGWDEDLKGWNDWELGVRILLTHPKVVGVDETLVDVYSQEDSITGKDFSSKAGRWEKSLDAVRQDIMESDTPDKGHLLRIVSYREIILAAHYAREGSQELARRLLTDSLADRPDSKHTLSLKDKLLLRLAYGYTRKGGRGAWRLLRFLL